METMKEEYPDTSHIANEWLLLFEIFAELVECDDLNGYDERCQKNQIQMWNACFTESLSEDDKALLYRTTDLKPDSIPELPSETLKVIAKRIHQDGRWTLPLDFKNISFKDIQFDHGLCLGGMIFFNLEFNNCEFENDTDLSGIHVMHSLEIKDCNFIKEFSCFDSTIEFGDFKNVVFSDDAHFGESDFGMVGFNNCTFQGTATFEDARFEIPSFINSTFSNTTSFENAQFLSYVPTFYSTSIHEDTNFSGAVWPNADPKITGEAGGVSIRAYECLRKIMVTQGKLDQEYLFMKLEMAVRRKSDSLGRTIPLYMYGVLSDYGWSYLRPALGMALIWLLGVVYFSIYVCREGSFTPDKPLRCDFDMMALSFSNLFSFLGIGRTLLTDEISSLDSVPFAEFTAGCQMVIGPILLFFILLALRNQFRMK
ncbi:MAG: hypothetical protein ABJO57_15005 [Lentilitoribacter sp.]